MSPMTIKTRRLKPDPVVRVQELEFAEGRSDDAMAVRQSATLNSRNW